MPLKLTRRPGSENWYLRGTVRGREIYESTGTGDRRAADDIRILRENEELRASIHGDSVVYTFTDAALSYLEAGGEGTHLAPLLTRFKGTPLSEIGQDAIDRAARELKPGCGPATWNRQIYTPMSAVINHAAKKTPSWCPFVRLDRPKAPKGRVRWISKDEAERLIAAARPHMQPLVIFLLATGCRISEALYLDWSEVDLSRCHVIVYGPAECDDDHAVNTKNGEPRGIPLHPRAVAALANLPHRTGAVFRKPFKGPAKGADNRFEKWLGDPYERRRGGGGMVKSSWSTMCAAAGITNFTPHDCRHTWATWHYIANRDLTKLMELGGWKSIDMVMRYTHVDKSSLAASIEDMWNWSGGRAKSVQSGDGKPLVSLSYKASMVL